RRDATRCIGRGKVRVRSVRHSILSGLVSAVATVSECSCCGRSADVSDQRSAVGSEKKGAARMGDRGLPERLGLESTEQMLQRQRLMARLIGTLHVVVSYPPYVDVRK